jgi:hypothetical protein
MHKYQAQIKILKINNFKLNNKIINYNSLDLIIINNKMVEIHKQTDNLIFKAFNKAIQNKILLKTMVQLFKKNKKCKNQL